MTIDRLASTYQQDIGLFQELGLQPFDIPLKQVYEVGTVEFDTGSTARLEVQCYPAQFWTATVFCAMTGVTVELEFTSGSLSNCWPMIKAMAQAEVIVNAIHDAYDEWYRTNA